MLEHIKKSGPLFGVIGAVGGFVADVLQPIAPFSSYLFFAAAFSTVAVLLTMIVNSSLRTKVAPAFMFSIIMMAVSGALYGIQSEEEKQSGVLAGQIPGVKTLQASLGLIREDVAAIKKSTENIEKTTARTEQVVKQVEKNTKANTAATKKVAEAVQDSTKQIVGSLAEIQKGFSALAQSGGVIANPERPEQFYHNARIQEQGGDYGNARRSYNRYFTFKLDFLDPHLRYQTFLKIQEGRAGAREIYSAIYERDPRPIVEFARNLLFDAPKRTEMLKKFISENPDFAPAYYELSREYSEARKGTQSLTDKKAELKALQEFETLRKGGQFLKFFVDKKLASKWIADVEKRLKLLSLVAETSAKSPVTMNASPSNQGWRVNLLISEKVREIFYKLEGEDEFKSTGLLKYIDSTTGLAMPNPMVSFSLNVENTTIFVKYIDINKNERGPFELWFVGKDLIASSNIRTLKQTKLSWLHLRKFQGKLLIYFSHLLSSKCGLSEIRYGVDKDVPDQVFEKGICDIKKSHSIGRGQKIYVKESLDTKFVTVQLTYADGTRSDVEKFMNE